jgi:hypothetical protein
MTKYKEMLLVTVATRSWRFSSSFHSFVVGSSAVLRLNFCVKIRHYAKSQNGCTKKYKAINEGLD